MDEDVRGGDAGGAERPAEEPDAAASEVARYEQPATPDGRGVRPLAAQQDTQTQSTKEISRSHRLMVSLSGLITITGGKWTTYRKMAEDTVNKAWMVGGLPERKCVTETMPIHGYVKNIRFDSPGYFYGSDRTAINDLIQTEPDLGQRLHPDYEYTRAQVVWAVRNEMARTVEDFLSRRIRMLLLDARISMTINNLLFK